ncbi:MAG: transposase family protein, partial [bacterium]|nr:transposase family protein [bacterium]
GCPRTIVTDQGTNIVSKLFKDFCSRLGIAHNYTTHYHRIANGEVERTHRTIMNRLATSMSESGEEWDELSSFVVMGYNSTHTLLMEKVLTGFILEKNQFYPLNLLSHMSSVSMQKLI